MGESVSSADECWGCWAEGRRPRNSENLEVGGREWLFEKERELAAAGGGCAAVGVEVGGVGLGLELELEVEWVWVWLPILGRVSLACLCGCPFLLKAANVKTLLLATACVCLPLAWTPGQLTWPARHSDVLPQRGLASGRDVRGPLASLSWWFGCGCWSGRLAEGVHVGRVSRVPRPGVLGSPLVRERVGGWTIVSVSSSG